MCFQKFLDTDVQTRISDQALIFLICELLYCFQIRYRGGRKYQPEFFCSLLGVELEPAWLRDFDGLFLCEIRRATIRGCRRKQHDKRGRTKHPTRAVRLGPTPVGRSRPAIYNVQITSL